MATATVKTGSPTGTGLAWEIAELFPAQGDWSEAEYLSLNTNRLVELSDGCVEVLPVATQEHQEIVAFFYNRLHAFGEANRLGKVLFAPMPVKLWADKMREPDVVFMKADNADRRTNQFWSGADVAMEVVSQDDRGRDLDVKRAEYARGKIPEYWIIDPLLKTVTVLALAGSQYAVAGQYLPGDVAMSVLLPGFEVDVAAAFGPK